MEGRLSIKEKKLRHAAGNNHDLKLTNENFICRSLLFEKKKCPVNVSITPVKNRMLKNTNLLLYLQLGAFDGRGGIDHNITI